MRPLNMREVISYRGGKLFPSLLGPINLVLLYLSINNDTHSEEEGNGNCVGGW